MQRDETLKMFWFYCSTESFPLCAVECFYSVLCDVLSLWHVCFSKFHRIIESYGQVRLGMVSQKKISHRLLSFQYCILLLKISSYYRVATFNS